MLSALSILTHVIHVVDVICVVLTVQRCYPCYLRCRCYPSYLRCRRYPRYPRCRCYPSCSGRRCYTRVVQVMKCVYVCPSHNVEAANVNPDNFVLFFNIVNIIIFYLFIFASYGKKIQKHWCTKKRIHCYILYCSILFGEIH